MNPTNPCNAVIRLTEMYEYERKSNEKLMSDISWEREYRREKELNERPQEMGCW